MIYSNEEAALAAGLSPSAADTSCSSSSASDSLLDSTSTESLGSSGTGGRVPPSGLDPHSAPFPGGGGGAGEHHSFYPQATLIHDDQYPIVVPSEQFSHHAHPHNGVSWLNSKAPPFFPSYPPPYSFYAEPPHQKMMCSIYIEPGYDTHNFQGPATVRMVSNNGPPVPMPMQVPPGHMVQQIVDEHGILTNVILSPQPPGMPAPPMTSPNGTPPQIYAPYGPQYTAQAYPHPSGYTPHHHQHPPGPPPHVHAGPPPPYGPPQPSTPAPGQNQCNSHSHPQHTHTQVLGGAPHSHAHDNRSIRTKRQARHPNKTQNYQPSSPNRTKGKMNGTSEGRRQDPASSSSSNDGQEMDEEEDRKAIYEILSQIAQPKVSNVNARSALIELSPPEYNQVEFEISPNEFNYELFLSEKGPEGKYKSVYKGEATEITLKDLKPVSEYYLQVRSLLDDNCGRRTDPVPFKTHSAEPDTPSPPKLANRTKNSMQIKWNSTADNGSKILSYSLEYDQGLGESNFVEIYSGPQKQHKLPHLTASTAYTFRLSATNAVGKSQYSDVVCFQTHGSVPSQPDPPMLAEQYVKALVISWIRRQNDDTFTLQMEDEATGHGFLTVYNGPELSYKIKNLRRNTAYRFRLSASNEEGNGRWSDVRCYRTLPDMPAAPPRPQIKGKVHSTHFRVSWDPPRDSGGSEVTGYNLEMDDDRGFEGVYEGPEKEYSCDDLHPGKTYRLRVSCSGAGGRSGWSEILAITTPAVQPGPCLVPKLLGKPKAMSLHLRWSYPDFDGGSQVTDYEVQMTNSDNTTREVYRGRDTECMVAGLSPGRPYILQVRAINKAGIGPWSDSLEVVSGAGVPDPPKMPTVTCKSAHHAVVSWDEPVNNGATITEYRLEWQARPDADFTPLYIGSALTYEVRNLSPATQYSFRIQALNSAGVGAFSAIGSCVTPPSSPGPVTSVKPLPSTHTITVTWKEPMTNGSDITSYNIDLGEKHRICVGNVTEYVIEDLLPETTYRIRVQAVNAYGVGQFSSSVKTTTRPLPPAPPRLECVGQTHNSLKLKWGDGKNPDLIQYMLEMVRDNGTFTPIYRGPQHWHKVNRLSELTEYEFRVSASNDAGEGPPSEVFSFKTCKAPPPALKAPKVLEVNLDSCLVEWQGCRSPIGEDKVIYNVQLQNCSVNNSDYRSVYRGEQMTYKITGLTAKTEWQVRVCAIRQCSDGTGDLNGAFSPGTTFTTTSPKQQQVQVGAATTAVSRLSDRRPLSDQQWAFILLLGFTVCAVLLALLAQRIIAYTTANNTAPTQ